MTRRDFQLIAGTLNSVAPRSYQAMEQHVVTVNKLADALAGTNPKFDRARFLSASGVGSELNNKGDHHE